MIPIATAARFFLLNTTTFFVLLFRQTNNIAHCLIVRFVLCRSISIIYCDVWFSSNENKTKKQTQLIFSLSIGICFYWANFLWMGKIQPNQLNWMNSWRHKKNHTQLQFTVFESQQLSVTCGSLETYACIFIVIREPYWKRG